MRFDEWYDWWRLIVFIVCSICLYILIARYRLSHEKWNVKTIDHWYAHTMWCLTGFVGMVQGVYLDRPLGPTLVILTMASFVTLRGLMRKGDWGGSQA